MRENLNCGRPWAIALVDLNGDSHIDAATSENYGRFIILHTNDGSGVLQLGSSYELGATNDISPRSIVAVDVSGDAHPDLAVALAGANTVKVLVNNGSGAFTMLGTYPTGTQPMGIDAASLNSDLHLDLVTANNNSSSVSVLFNHGDASLERGMRLSSDYYWLVTGPVLVEQNATLRIDPGTQVEFWNGQSQDPLNPDLKSYIQVEGRLVADGTSEQPVEMFPSALRPDHAVKIVQNGLGSSELHYAHVRNPLLRVAQIDHSYFDQTGNSVVGGDNGNHPEISAVNIDRSNLHKLGGPYSELIVGGQFATSLFDTTYAILTPRSMTNSVLLKNYVYDASVGGQSAWWPTRATSRLDQNWLTSFRDNAVLNDWLDVNLAHWMRIYAEGTRGQVLDFSSNYWSTKSTEVINACIWDYTDNFNLPTIAYEPRLVEPPTTTYPFVADVTLQESGGLETSALNGPTPIVGAKHVTFKATFNRNMDTTVEPTFSFGPARPYTDFMIPGNWVDARTWQGEINITPVTGDGYQLIRVAGAVAADDPWLVTGDDAGRFRFEIITSGTECMNLQATGGEGRVNLTWTQNDFDLLAGFNLYRSTSQTGTYSRINTSIIPPQTRAYADTAVTPGTPTTTSSPWSSPT